MMRFEDLKVGDKVRYGPFKATVNYIAPDGTWLSLDNNAELSPGDIQLKYMERL